MKEIKFMAWNGKEMFGPFTFKEIRRGGWAFPHEQCGVDLSSPQTNVMQYTGLKDKNGKEIYEGDIVRNNWTRTDGISLSNLWEVKFGEYSDADLEYGSSGHVGFYANNLDPREIEHSECALHGLSTDNCSDDFEIIGNIYENPDLLNERN